MDSMDAGAAAGASGAPPAAFSCTVADADADAAAAWCSESGAAEPTGGRPYSVAAGMPGTNGTNGAGASSALAWPYPAWPLWRGRLALGGWLGLLLRLDRTCANATTPPEIPKIHRAETQARRQGGTHKDSVSTPARHGTRHASVAAVAPAHCAQHTPSARQLATRHACIQKNGCTRRSHSLRPQRGLTLRRRPRPGALWPRPG